MSYYDRDDRRRERSRDYDDRDYDRSRRSRRYRSSRSHSRSRSRSRSRSPEYRSHRSSQSSAPPPSSSSSHRPPILTPEEKINRELFIGNTPPGTSEALLMQFLNGAMRRVNLCPPDGSPILACRLNQKFAFVECASVQDANNALNLTGIPFLGASLKVSRPSKYCGPFVAHSTWQQLTGQPIIPGMTGDVNADEKMSRELFIGNTTPEMTDVMIRDFLGRAMEQVGLTIMPGNPINTVRVSGKFAFVELRTAQEAANALNLNGIPYLGASLKVGRPSKYAGPETPHGNWEDILAKFMSGELQLNNAAAAPAQAPVAAAAPIQAQSMAPTRPRPTPIVELKYMLTQQDLDNDEEFKEIMEDTRDECSSFGLLKNVIIPRSGPGATKIFLEYTTAEEAAKAIAGLAGRTFDGRQVVAAYFDQVKFQNQDFSD